LPSASAVVTCFASLKLSVAKDTGSWVLSVILPESIQKGFAACNDRWLIIKMSTSIQFFIRFAAKLKLGYYHAANHIILHSRENNGCFVVINPKTTKLYVVLAGLLTYPLINAFPSDKPTVALC
jgi:hypothetical protein